MPASSSSYGNFNPQALDPYPVENALAAAIAKDTPDLAYPMLNTYRLQRENAGNMYGRELEAQHQQARANLAATIADNQAKNALGFLKEPRGLEFAANAPDYRYLLGGADTGPQGAVADIAGQQRRAGEAKILSDVAGGAYHNVQAGLDVPAGSYGQLTGLPTSQGTPLGLKEAAIHASTAASRAAGDRPPTGSVQFKGRDGRIYTLNYGGKTGINTEDDINAHIDKMGGVRMEAPPPVTPGTKTGTGLKPNQGGGGTATHQQSQQVVPLQSSAPGVKEYQTQIGQVIDRGDLKRISPDADARARAGMAKNGGQPWLGKGPGGKVYVLDGNGQPVVAAN